MELPDEPANDAFTAYLLSTFRNIGRGRRIVATMAAPHQMPLSVREISDWCEAHPPPIPRDMLDEIMFALDRVYLTDLQDA